MIRIRFKKEVKEKAKILDYLVKNNIDSVNGVGRIVAEYYTNKNNLMKYVNSNKVLDEVKEHLEDE
ncbi:MAG: hypothetical protein ACMXX9_01005 [Candidatus Woesearchaeota archaeon]